MSEDKLKKHEQFLIEEYKALRSEIEHKMTHLQQIIYVNVLGCGAIWYLIIKDLMDKNPNCILYWMPSILCFLSGLYMINVRRDVRRMGSYILHIESEFFNINGNLGWEHFLVRYFSKGWNKNTHIFELISWIVLMGVNLFGALYLPKDCPF